MPRKKQTVCQICRNPLKYPPRDSEERFACPECGAVHQWITDPELLADPRAEQFGVLYRCLRPRCYGYYIWGMHRPFVLEGARCGVCGNISSFEVIGPMTSRWEGPDGGDIRAIISLMQIPETGEVVSIVNEPWGTRRVLRWNDTINPLPEPTDPTPATSSNGDDFPNDSA